MAPASQHQESGLQDEALAEANAELTAEPAPKAEPLDRAWPRQERAAQSDASGDEDQEPPGDAASVQDVGPLESLGRAVSAPVRDSEPEPARSDPRPVRRGTALQRG